jgi:signal transduction histidine kinase
MLTLRRRILLTLIPLLILLSVLGTAALLLLSQLGTRIDQILRDNYESIIYMEQLNEALDGIDSSFVFALAQREERARKQFEENWKQYDENLKLELGNVTILPREQDLCDELTRLTEEYRKAGDAFMKAPPDQRRAAAYYGEGDQPGLHKQFENIKNVAGDILKLNQDNMLAANTEALTTAKSSQFWFSAGFLLTAGLAVLLAVQMVRTILLPIRAVTDAALAIGAGNLNQVVPEVSGDELGQLAGAFNTMARQLRGFRHSAEARLVRAQQTSQATINAFPFPVLVVDEESRVEMANPAARHLLGVLAEGPARSTVNWQPLDALRRPLNEALRNQRAHLPEGFDQAIALRSGEQEHFFLPRILPIRDPDGETLGAAIMMEDVTRFRLLDQVKSNLVATVSHELKTPLTSLRLAVHLLLEETVGPLTPKQTELLLDARDNTERLLAMINNLLDLGRLEEGRHLVRSPEPPLALVQSAADVIRPRAEDKGVTVVVDVPPNLPAVAADARQMSHALQNLLDNALRYTDSGGKITLSAAQDGNQVVFSVTDTGRGIPPEHMAHLFERFFRVPGQEGPDGIGLGLAIVREIVTAHGGTVVCESKPGEGATFRLTLPVAV